MLIVCYEVEYRHWEADEAVKMYFYSEAEAKHYADRCCDCPAYVKITPKCADSDEVMIF